MIIYFRYIVFNVPVHAYATLSVVNQWFTKSRMLSQVYLSLTRSKQLTRLGLKKNITYFQGVSGCFLIFTTIPRKSNCKIYIFSKIKGTSERFKPGEGPSNFTKDVSSSTNQNSPKCCRSTSTSCTPCRPSPSVPPST